jgi:hypothetical protein
MGGGKMWGKDVGGRIWCQYCLYMYVSGKMRTVKTIPGMGRELKENDGGGEFNYDILLRTFVNVTMYPHTTIRYI